MSTSSKEAGASAPAPFSRRLRSWEPNPILLYELRQALRSRFVTVLLLLYTLTTGFFLAGLLSDEFFCTVFFEWMEHWNIRFSDGSRTTRLTVFVLMCYYAFATTTLVGFGSGRTAWDRLHENPALFTTLSPWRIVSGKLQFGVVGSLLLLSVTLPYLSILYLMRGVDIRTIFTGGSLFFGMTLVQYFAAVAFFAGVKTRIRLVAVTLPALLLQYILTCFSMYIAPEMSTSINGEFSYMLEIVFLAMIFGLAITPLFLLTTVQLSPETSNRMFPVRVTGSVIQLSLLTAFCIAAIFYDFDSMFVGMFGSMTFMFSLAIPYLFLFCICERESLSPRIRRTIPKTRWKRLLVFPFYTGMGGAMLWSGLTLLLLLIVCPIFWAADPSGGSDYSMTVAFLGCFNFGLLAFDYCATTLLIYNLFFSRRFPREWNWVFPFLLIGGIILLALFSSKIAALLSISLDVDDILRTLPILPIPWPFHERMFVLTQTVIGGIWFLLLFAISVPWMRRQFLKFVPLEAEAAGGES